MNLIDSQSAPCTPNNQNCKECYKDSTSLALKCQSCNDPTKQLLNVMQNQCYEIKQCIANKQVQLAPIQDINAPCVYCADKLIDENSLECSIDAPFTRDKIKITKCKDNFFLNTNNRCQPVPICTDEFLTAYVKDGQAGCKPCNFEEFQYGKNADGSVKIGDNKCIKKCKLTSLDDPNTLQCEVCKEGFYSDTTTKNCVALPVCDLLTEILDRTTNKCVKCSDFVPNCKGPCYNEIPATGGTTLIKKCKECEPTAAITQDQTKCLVIPTTCKATETALIEVDKITCTPCADAKFAYYLAQNQATTDCAECDLKLRFNPKSLHCKKCLNNKVANNGLCVALQNSVTCTPPKYKQIQSTGEICIEADPKQAITCKATATGQESCETIQCNNPTGQKVLNCDTCKLADIKDLSTFKCERCSLGYQLTATGLCIFGCKQDALVYEETGKAPRCILCSSTELTGKGGRGACKESCKLTVNNKLDSDLQCLVPNEFHYVDSTTKIAQRCFESNTYKCKICKDGNTADKCLDQPVGLVNNGQDFVRCQVQLCAKCEVATAATQCLQCAPTFNKISITGKPDQCVKCNFDNCDECGANGCIKCKKDDQNYYIPNIDGTCVLVQQQNCDSAVITPDNGLICQNCKKGYYLDNESRSCKACSQIPNCLACAKKPTKGLQCLSCDSLKNQIVQIVDTSTSGDDLCVDRTTDLPTDCQATRKVNNNLVCVSCSGQSFLKDGQCLKCISRCKICEPTKQDQCLICELGYYFDSTKKSCEACPVQEGCVACSNFMISPSGSVFPSQAQCIRCKIGYYLFDGKCAPCHQSCLSCLGPSENDCTTCKNQNALDLSNRGIQFEPTKVFQRFLEKLSTDFKLGKALTLQSGQLVKPALKSEAELANADCQDFQKKLQELQSQQTTKTADTSDASSILGDQTQSATGANSQDISKLYASCKNPFSNNIPIEDLNLWFRVGKCLTGGPAECLKKTTQTQFYSYDSEKQTCIKCFEGCTKCHGETFEDCNECQIGYSKQKQIVVKQTTAEDSTGSTSTQISTSTGFSCQKCHPSCSSCIDFQKGCKSCLTCVAQQPFLDFDGQCLTSCQINFYPIKLASGQQVCKQNLNPNCLIANRENPKLCNVCNDGFFGSECLKCPENTRLCTQDSGEAQLCFKGFIRVYNLKTQKFTCERQILQESYVPRLESLLFQNLLDLKYEDLINIFSEVSAVINRNNNVNGDNSAKNLLYILGDMLSKVKSIQYVEKLLELPGTTAASTATTTTSTTAGTTTETTQINPCDESLKVLHTNTDRFRLYRLKQLMQETNNRLQEELNKQKQELRNKLKAQTASEVLNAANTLTGGTGTTNPTDKSNLIENQIFFESSETSKTQATFFGRPISIINSEIIQQAIDKQTYKNERISVTFEPCQVNCQKCASDLIDFNNKYCYFKCPLNYIQEGNKCIVDESFKINQLQCLGIDATNRDISDLQDLVCVVKTTKDTARCQWSVQFSGLTTSETINQDQFNIIGFNLLVKKDLLKVGKYQLSVICQSGTQKDQKDITFSVSRREVMEKIELIPSTPVVSGSESIKFSIVNSAADTTGVYTFYVRESINKRVLQQIFKSATGKEISIDKDSYTKNNEEDIAPTATETLNFQKVCCKNSDCCKQQNAAFNYKCQEICTQVEFEYKPVRFIDKDIKNFEAVIFYRNSKNLGVKVIKFQSKKGQAVTTVSVDNNNVINDLKNNKDVSLQQLSQTTQTLKNDQEILQKQRLAEALYKQKLQQELLQKQQTQTSTSTSTSNQPQTQTQTQKPGEQQQKTGTTTQNGQQTSTTGVQPTKTQDTAKQQNLDKNELKRQEELKTIQQQKLEEYQKKGISLCPGQNTCFGNGECVLGENSRFYCKCTEEWTGEGCQFKTEELKKIREANKLQAEALTKVQVNPNDQDAAKQFSKTVLEISKSENDASTAVKLKDAIKQNLNNIKDAESLKEVMSGLADLRQQLAKKASSEITAQLKSGTQTAAGTTQVGTTATSTTGTTATSTQQTQTTVKTQKEIQEERIQKKEIMEEFKQIYRQVRSEFIKQKLSELNTKEPIVQVSSDSKLLVKPLQLTSGTTVSTQSQTGTTGTAGSTQHTQTATKPSLSTSQEKPKPPLTTASSIKYDQFVGKTINLEFPKTATTTNTQTTSTTAGTTNTQPGTSTTGTATGTATGTTQTTQTQTTASTSTATNGGKRQLQTSDSTIDISNVNLDSSNQYYLNLPTPIAQINENVLIGLNKQNISAIIDGQPLNILSYANNVNDIGSNILELTIIDSQGQSINVSQVQKSYSYIFYIAVDSIQEASKGLTTQAKSCYRYNNFTNYFESKYCSYLGPTSDNLYHACSCTLQGQIVVGKKTVDEDDKFFIGLTTLQFFAILGAIIAVFILIIAYVVFLRQKVRVMTRSRAIPIRPSSPETEKMSAKQTKIDKEGYKVY